MELNFNAAAVKDEFQQVPDGQYVVMATYSELKDAKFPGNKYLAVRFSVLEGDYSGSSIFANFNLINPNEKAVKFAQVELKRFCEACGKSSIRMSEELHNIPLIVEVKTEEKDGFSNTRIKKWLSINQKTQVQEIKKPVPPVAPVATGVVPPWLAQKKAEAPEATGTPPAPEQITTDGLPF